MAFKMKGWAPKGPLRYKGGGKAINMPTSNPAFKIEDPVISGDSGSSYENLNDDVNITGMRIEPGQQTLSLDHDDIHNLQVAVQRGGLDKATRDAYIAAINRGPGKPMVVDPESGELNFQTSTGAITTRPGSSDAMNNLLTTLDQGRAGGNYPEPLDEEQMQKDQTKQFTRDITRDVKRSGIENVDKSNRLTYIPEEKEDEEKVEIYKPGKKDSESTGKNITDSRNIEGNKGGKTLSQKRATSVGKEKLDTYAKAWNDNRGNVRSKYKTQAQVEKAAKEWWAKKGLDK